MPKYGPYRRDTKHLSFQDSYAFVYQISVGFRPRIKGQYVLQYWRPVIGVRRIALSLSNHFFIVDEDQGDREALFLARNEELGRWLDDFFVNHLGSIRRVRSLLPA